MKTLGSTLITVNPRSAKCLIVLLLLAFAFIASPHPALAEVNVSINIPLPPPFVFSAPPEVVVLPGTYVYVIPDYDQDIFFYDGWWWCTWQGHWYRSHNYNSGWSYYDNVPHFYSSIPPSWRSDYRDHRWRGQHWNYRRIPHQELHQNWSNWEKEKHWEKEQTWGVQGYRKPPEAVRPESPAIQKGKAAAEPQPTRPRTIEPQPQQHRPEAQPAQPRAKEPHPQQYRPETRPDNSRSNESATPQQVQPQPKEEQKQYPQQQDRNPKKQPNPKSGKPGDEEEEQRDKNRNDYR
jgi:hypothetical protein